MGAVLRTLFLALLTFSTSLGAFTPAAALAGQSVVDGICAEDEQTRPVRPATCDDDIGRLLQLLVAVQSQLIQEEEEHPPCDHELAGDIAPSGTHAHREPLLLEGEDMSPALLRPPRGMSA